MASGLMETTIFLGSAVVAVPLFKRAGLGSVLGYLAAGVVIGPFALGLIHEVDEILHFSELGVVFLLFIIGLELQPTRLWAMRKNVFGLGGLQVGLTSVLLIGVGLAFGLGPKAAIVVALALSLSSTAFVLQILAEKHQLATLPGQRSFGILLFQDLIVIPIVALMPLLAANQSGADAIPTWPTIFKVLGVFVGVVLISRTLVRPLFRLVASAGSHEIFTAMALLVVIGSALLMQAIGLSMALGAFLAGVLLADSEYRHALEADINPFKGLLLGLFFISVGMSVNLSLLTDQWLLILGLVAILMTLKACVLFGLARAFGLDSPGARTLAFVLPQGGEFAFVLFGVATGFSVLDQNLADLLILVVTVSMILTPFLVLLNEKIFNRGHGAGRREYDKIESSEPSVIIAGFGRFGQIIARVLSAKHIPFTALDNSSAQVDFVRKFGNKIYYGDPARLDLLRAAGIDHARVLVIAVNNRQAAIKIAKTVLQEFPHVTIFARAYDRLHAYKLLDQGVVHVERETFRSSLEMAGQVLQNLGLTYSAARQAMDTFQEHDEAMLKASYQYHDNMDELQSRAKQAAEELESLFKQDAASDG